jgi:hypothetical protein
MHKTIILDWIDANPDFCGYHPMPDASCITEVSKTTTKAGLTIRKYEIAGKFAHYNDLYVLENADGTLTVLTDDPDRKWGFSIEIQEEPGEFRDRVVWFYTADISSSSHVSFYLRDRLPPTAYETMESAFEFDDTITDESLIAMLVAAGFTFVGYYDMSDDALVDALISAGLAHPEDYDR